MGTDLRNEPRRLTTDHAENSRQPLVDFAASAVCTEFRITRSSLFSSARGKQESRGRRALAITLSEHGFSQAELVRIIDRDHSFVSRVVRDGREALPPDATPRLERVREAVRGFAAGVVSLPPGWWCAARDAVLKAMWAHTTMSDDEIATALGCAVSDVAARAEAIGLMSDDYPILEVAE